MDGELGDESAVPERSADTGKKKGLTYVFLSVEHEAAIELGELTEGHVSVPQLRVLQNERRRLLRHTTSLRP